MFFSITYLLSPFYFFFFFNDTATTEIYTLSLHDALPIWPEARGFHHQDRRHLGQGHDPERRCQAHARQAENRSEEHTSELQSPCNLVCRLLLEKKNYAGNCAALPPR